ncbi:hypothetical protein DTL42_14910 [Bremerella cremea]|uniref:Uncharacterized protein n=1 Tax=Bremerella cremea TaxID=1031537 RepID=A0A368KRS8_9BACT|nr:hypothetical protein DTL42_14910 [Bremerella cremea]
MAAVNGDIQQRFAYEPYGEDQELDSDFTAYSGVDLKWTVRFTGQELDLGTGLQLCRNRYLQQSLGKWISSPLKNPHLPAILQQDFPIAKDG